MEMKWILAALGALLDQQAQRVLADCTLTSSKSVKDCTLTDGTTITGSGTLPDDTSCTIACVDEYSLADFGGDYKITCTDGSLDKTDYQNMCKPVAHVCPEPHYSDAKTVAPDYAVSSDVAPDAKHYAITCAADKEISTLALNSEGETEDGDGANCAIDESGVARVTPTLGAGCFAKCDVAKPDNSDFAAGCINDTAAVEHLGNKQSCTYSCASGYKASGDPTLSCKLVVETQARVLEQTADVYNAVCQATTTPTPTPTTTNSALSKNSAVSASLFMGVFVSAVMMM